jgi:DNA repair exonuclease SbcCD ATPase subunit
MDDTTLDDRIAELPTIQDHEDVEAAIEALANAKERLASLEDRKAEVEAQIPELRARVNDLHVEVAEGSSTEEDLQAAREAVEEAQDTVERLEARQIPSARQAVERLDDRVEEVKDRLGNEFAPQYQEAALELLDAKAERLRDVADLLDLVDTFDGKRASNRIQNAYRPEIPSVPTLEGTVEVAYKDEHEPDELRDRADELDEQAARLREGE